MSTSVRSQRRGHEDKGKIGKVVGERSASFHGHNLTAQERMYRRKTDSDLLSGRKSIGISPEVQPRLTKLLLNVTVQRSPGAVQVVMSPECSVRDLVAAAVKQYVKEGRRPFLVTNDPGEFDLHYSQFSLESLNREEKLHNLGSRNFFLCPNKSVIIAAAATTTVTKGSTMCSDQVGRTSKNANPWLRFIDFLM